MGKTVARVAPSAVSKAAAKESKTKAGKVTKKKVLPAGKGSSKNTNNDAKAIAKGSNKKGDSTSQEEAIRKEQGYTESLPKRNAKGELVFQDYPEMRPNMTPKEVLQAGSFGGTYFRPIKSSVTGEKYSGVWKELPKNWLEGLDISKQVASSPYRAEVNTYKVKCGGSLEMWESSGWIDKQDPYGWFMWYCRFYLGRRTADDERQVGRWKKCAGVKGRWRNNLIAKCARSGCAYDNFAVSPVVRQTLQHWGYRLTKEDFEKAAKRFK
ncbi:uncharacterized protein LOC121413715 [Lytechinus variegatus]|uniref:uncharacterized protein LOC121413715 n=1 Tax=Lytechinus variegatus TaxID=7654 RepID=UPI001BB114EF|nr:uncharacterized protein LOC121413715 [Lytechinus variegatus]